MRHRAFGLAFGLTVLALSAVAFAGEMRPTSVRVHESATSGSAVTVAGKLDTPSDLTLPTDVEFRCGAFAQTLAPADMVATTKSLTYKAPKGTKTGILKFTLSLKTGKLTLAVKGIDAGSLDDPMPLTLDVGGQRFTALFPLKGSGRTRSWRKGQPLQGVLDGRVLRLGHALGNTVLSPASDMAFVRNDTEEPDATVVGGSPVTDADGRFSITIEYRDPSVLSRLDLGQVLGEEGSLTRPGHVAVTQGEDGVLEAVAFVQKESGAGGTVTPGSGYTFEVPGASGAPSGTLSVPSGSVTADAPGLSFTPYAMAVELPAPLPEGYVALAGAEVKAASAVAFVAAKAPTVEISRPSWTEKDPLSTADIKLLQFRSGLWVEQAGRGIYNPLTDRFIPDPASPAKLAEASPVVYAAKVSVGTGREMHGRVEDKDGNAVAGVTVLSRAGGTVSGSRGSFTVPKSTVSASALEVVQVVSEGSSTGTVLSANASADEVTVQVADTAPPDWMVGVVLGTVTESGGGTPVAGATVTLAIAGSVRGLLHDDAGTTDNFADDTFAVPDLASLGVTSYQWALTLPGQPAEFTSAVYTSNTVSPTLLMLEAQAGGRTIPDGAYTVRVAYTIPSLGSYSLFGGFRVTSIGIDLTVSDIQVPAGFEGTPSVQVTTNATGKYVKFYRAPQGIPMTASAVSAGGNNTNTRTFTFDSIVTVDLEVDGPPPPDSIPVGWSVRTAMPTSRAELTVGAVGGRIYAVAARLATPWPDHVEEYDPGTDSWSAMASWATQDYGGAGTSMGGLVYHLNQGSVRAYDPSSDSWATKDGMIHRRVAATVGAVNGKLYAFGGTDLDAGGLSSSAIDEYDPQLNVWAPRTPLPAKGRVGATGAVVDGVLYVVGGLLPDEYVWAIADVWAYSPISDSWTTRAPMPAARASACCGVINGEIYVIGGNDAARLTFSTLYIYNPSSNTWRKGPAMPKAKVSFATAVVGGVLYAIGGSDPDTGGYSDVVYAYRPK